MSDTVPLVDQVSIISDIAYGYSGESVLFGSYYKHSTSFFAWNAHQKTCIDLLQGYANSPIISYTSTKIVTLVHTIDDTMPIL